MCGEDGIKRAVYNVKRGHAGKGSEHREEKREDSRRNVKNERTVSISKKNRLLYQF